MNNRNPSVETENRSPDGETGAKANLAEIVSYIAAREGSLGRYSDKLRINVQSVFDLFGKPELCAQCDTWAKDERHTEADHRPKPKVRLSFTVIGESFRVIGENFSEAITEWYLEASDGRLRIVTRLDGDENDYYTPTQAPRDVLKALVKEKAITAFLDAYVKQLDQTTDEYRAVSEAAEKMAASLK